VHEALLAEIYEVQSAIGQMTGHPENWRRVSAVPGFNGRIADNTCMCVPPACPRGHAFGSAPSAKSRTKRHRTNDMMSRQTLRLSVVRMFHGAGREQRGAEMLSKFSGEGARSARFSLDDRWLVIQCWGQAHVWNLSAGREVEQHNLDEFAAFMLGSDRWCTQGPVWRMWIGQVVEPQIGAETLVTRNRQRALFRRNGSALLFDLQTQESVGAFKEPYPTESCVVLSPDGFRLLHSGTDSTACLRDAVTGELIHRLEGHQGLVYTAAFSQDARWAVTASADYTARIWDLRTGKWAAALRSRHDGAWVVIDPDLRYDIWDPGDANGNEWLEAVGTGDGSLREGHYTPGLLPSVLASSVAGGDSGTESGVKGTV
jgi:hypothetical protein